MEPEAMDVEPPCARGEAADVEVTDAVEVLSPAEERLRVTEQEQKDQMSSGLQAGKHYYLLNRRWHVAWLQWVGHYSVQSPKHGPVGPVEGVPVASLDEDATDVTMSICDGPATSPMIRRPRSWTKERPGPITNEGLLDPLDPSSLARNLCENEDYEIVSEGVWSLLHGWYHGGPPIKRSAIVQPSGGVVVELYGLKLKLFQDASLLSTSIVEFKTTTVEAFKRRVCEKMGVAYDKSRLWDYLNRRKLKNLDTRLDQTLDDCQINEDNDILLETQLPDGSWPADEAPKSTLVSSYTSGIYSGTEDVPMVGTPLEVGVTGLQNLGNTCFMNSSLQCLSSVPAMTQYFLTGKYREDLNETAFKTHGKFAEAYAQLLSKMWSPTTCQVAPRSFKWQVGQLKEQFAGYGQQDSMEFIEYVLDGVKEDVNKIKGTKPFVELKEADSREDKEVAAEARENYSRRNDSKIDDYFLGFFKSTVSCPQAGCERVSVTFDPFLSVRLSLVSGSEDRSVSLDVLVVPSNGVAEDSVKQRVKVSKFGNAGNIIESAAKTLNLDSKNCILTEVYAKKVHKYFELVDSVEQIRSDDILVLYELDDATEFLITPEQRWGSSFGGITSGGINRDASSEDTKTIRRCSVVIHHRQMRQSSGLYSYNSGPSVQLLGIPFLVCVNKQSTGTELMEVVKSELAKHLGSTGEGLWKLFRTSQKWTIADCKDPVEADDEVVTLESREYLVVEWEEGAEVPELLNKLTELSSERSFSGSGKARGTESVELEKLFAMYTETEQLSAMEAWYCNKCKDHREAFKKIEFWTLPPVLIVQLKRFTYTQYTRERLDTAVIFPLENLDLSSYCLDAETGVEHVYDLVGVSKHIGGLGGGHYVAYSRSSENGKWYYFNDASVTEVSAATVAEDQVGAYVLFYLRRDHRPVKWGPPQSSSHKVTTEA
eukprot:TRINITY_DN27036_c0_g2_i1.p1 TRINITY_DN27036_c0_g2~~TRINITY_DN27036_c0_g2_i1.p1  ORF type:complete len:943 (+),score=177.45 TRINITY_DN27036_c0_g2_i1:22-2829(+)